MPEQCSTKREVSNDKSFTILSDQLASLCVGEIGSIRCSPSVAHFDGLSVDDKLELRLNGQPLYLASPLQ